MKELHAYQVTQPLDITVYVESSKFYRTLPIGTLFTQVPSSRDGQFQIKLFIVIKELNNPKNEMYIDKPAELESKASQVKYYLSAIDSNTDEIIYYDFESKAYFLARLPYDKHHTEKITVYLLARNEIIKGSNLTYTSFEEMIEYVKKRKRKSIKQ